ncbi:MAG: MGMT family protein [Clostridium sp.]
MSFYNEVYKEVKKIPRGKVASYGYIAFMAGSKNASRAVGYALHKNPDQGSIPCHRVVNREGRLAPSFAFGGMEAQAALLESEGVQVVNGYVDMDKYGLKKHQ